VNVLLEEKQWQHACAAQQEADLEDLKGWSGTGMGCPERWWSHQPGRCSRNIWPLCWGTWFSETHWWRADGWTGWSCGSFPTLAILWFYDSMIPCHLSSKSYINDKSSLAINYLQNEQNKREGNMYSRFLQKTIRLNPVFPFLVLHSYFLVKDRPTHVPDIWTSCLEINGKVPVISKNSWILPIFIGHD